MLVAAGAGYGVGEFGEGRAVDGEGFCGVAGGGYGGCGGAAEGLGEVLMRVSKFLVRGMEDVLGDSLLMLRLLMLVEREGNLVA